VLIFDMALLGLLAVDQGRVMTAPVVESLLLLNPADIYRLLNLTVSANVSMFAGMAGLADNLSLGRATLFLALGVWIAVPLGLAAFAFSRREL
jgi:Cu-processing system permease protein